MSSTNNLNFAVQFHDETASMDSNGNSTYTVVYMVVVPKGTRASVILANANSFGLPIHTSTLNNVPVSSINVDRWSEEHAMELAGIPHAAIWKYTVVYAKNTSGGGGGGGGSGSDTPDGAYNISLSVKTYTERVSKTLDVTKTTKDGRDISYSDRNKKLVTNALGEIVYRDIEVINAVLSFDYVVKKLDPDLLPQYLGTVNENAITVAGFKFEPKKGRIIALAPSVQQDSDGDDYIQLHVEIEMEIYKSVFKDTLLGNSRYAIPIEEKDKKDKKPYPIQLLSCNVSDIDGYTDVKWFNKERKLGYFGEAKKGGVLLNPSLYSYVTEEYPLNKDGTLYVGTKTDKGTYIIDINDANLNKIEVTDSYITNWKTLDLPTKGFNVDYKKQQ